VNRRNDGSFLQRLEHLARGFDLNPTVVRDASALLRRVQREQRIANLQRSGPCLKCRSLIYYDELSQAHQRWGDKWYRKVFAIWEHLKGVMEVEVFAGGQLNKYQMRLNGYAAATVWPYLCAKCRADIVSIRDEKIERQFGRKRVRLRRL
jgi:hypothetical protein